MTANPIINVGRALRGGWEVRLPDDDEKVICQNLEDAVHVGYRWAADGRGRELVVHDAYNRVIQRQFVSAGHPGA